MDGGGDRFDVAILGAGVAGLSLAWLLDAREALRGLRVVLVDGARDDDELRTLSFWSAGPVALEPLVRHSWSMLRVHDEQGRPHDVPLHEHTYRTLYLADLQRAVKARLAARGGTVVDGRAGPVTADARGASFRVGDRELRARWVLDSRFHRRDLAVDGRRHHLLRQHVHGWVVRAPHDAFDPGVATLLDFRVPGHRPGTAFHYVLPTGPRQALVELVTFRPVDAEPVMRDHLARALGVPEVELLDREAGVTPMTEQPFGWRDGPRVRRIGTAAGLLKPSTGYGLTRMLDDAARVVAALEAHGHPFAPVPRRRGYRFLDGVLLELWTEHPEAVPVAFARLFTRNPGDRVLRFLDERAGPGDLAGILATLPTGPFVGAAASWAARRAHRRPPPGPA